MAKKIEPTPFVSSSHSLFHFLFIDSPYLLYQPKNKKLTVFAFSFIPFSKHKREHFIIYQYPIYSVFGW